MQTEETRSELQGRFQGSHIHQNKPGNRKHPPRSPEGITHFNCSGIICPIAFQHDQNKCYLMDVNQKKTVDITKFNRISYNFIQKMAG